MPIVKEWQLVIHGGAGVIERERLLPEREHQIRAGLGSALDAGVSVLEDGGPSLDAVEAAVRVLEDDPLFNAGRGAALTRAGTIELDAAIMDGGNRRAGAVAGATRARNPVSLARAIMERSEHVLLGGRGADAFAEEVGLDLAEQEWFETEHRRKQLETLGSFDAQVRYGTVGAVALDATGHVAAATSTGGLTGKRPGRIGDSPLIGAGTYADDRVGAVSATGSGEDFIRAVAAHEICARMRLTGESAQSAAEAVIADLGALGGSGGVIAVTPRGEAAWAFNSEGMYRGRASTHGREIAIF